MKFKLLFPSLFSFSDHSFNEFAFLSICFCCQSDIDVFQVLFLPTPLFDFLQDETLQLLVRLMFRRMRETWSDRERKFYYNMWNRIIG